MRRLALVSLTLSLAACGSPARAPDVARPSAAAAAGSVFACGSSQVRLPAMPPGMTRSGALKRIPSLKGDLRIKGESWSRGAEKLHVGVVCGVRTAEEFASLVERAGLGMHQGRPALSWQTRGGVHHFMWLERPGTAVYVAATPGLATEIDRIADAAG
jgi:hypothetical protein